MSTGTTVPIPETAVRPPSAMRRKPFGDPLAAIALAMAAMARGAGFLEVGFVTADEGDYRVDLDEAFEADGLMPAIVRRAAHTFELSRLGAVRAFPLAIERDEETLLGERTVWRDNENNAALGVTLAAIADTMRSLIDENARTQTPEHVLHVLISATD